MKETLPAQDPPKKGKEAGIPEEPIAEKVILSLMMQSPEVIAKVQRLVTEDDFLGSRALIFTACCELYLQGDAVSPLTVYRHLQDRDLSEDSGDAAELASFFEIRDFAASILELDFHIKKVLEASRRRHVLRATSKLAKQAQAEDVDLDAAAGLFQSLARARPGLAPAGPSHIRDVLLGVIDKMEGAARGESNALPTGHTALDTILGGGLWPHGYTVIAARPSRGKTSLAMDILWNVASRETPVTAISLETKRENLGMRLLANVARVPFQRLRLGRLSVSEAGRQSDAANRMAQVPMRFFDPPLLDCNQLRNLVRREVTEYGSRVLMVDYLQLLRNSIKGNDKEYDRVTEVSQTIKELCQEFPVTILAVCQLKRNDNREPTMEDLRSSGQIEQDATEIILLSDAEDAADEASEIDLRVRIAKQKDGARGEAFLRFNRPTFRFSAAA